MAFKFNNTLMKFVRKDLDSNLIPMLLGEPGIGKSSWLMALADLMHTKCFVLACNQLADKADLTGARLVPVEIDQKNPDGSITKMTTYKQVFYPHAIIHDAIEYAKANPRETPILFMDELNRTTPDVTSEALSIPTLRAIGSVELPSNLRVVIAGNDKGNVTSLDEASISRFVLYHVEPDTQTFLGLDPELNVFVKNVLTAHPECIFGKTIVVSAATDKKKDDDDDESVSIDDILDDGESMNQITTPRTISAISHWLNSFSNEELIEASAITHIIDGVEVSALQEGIEGHIGHTLFSELLLSEIATGLQTVNNQANVVSVGKPQCYDQMKLCNDMTSLSNYIGSMSDNDRSGCLLYALYEAADNTVYIQAIAPMVNKMMPADMKTIMRLSASDSLDSENVRTLLNTNTNIATTLSVILETAS